jgi:hypothetical protein
MSMMPKLSRVAAALLAVTALTQGASPVLAQVATPVAGATYADVADLADSAAMVVHARIRKLARVSATT